MPLNESEVKEMPYAVVEDKIAKVSPQYRGELLAFIDFLIFKQRNDVSSDGAASDVVRSAPKRKAGGLTGDFYMAPDFDEPLECFKEYM